MKWLLLGMLLLLTTGCQSEHSLHIDNDIQGNTLLVAHTKEPALSIINPDIHELIEEVSLPFSVHSMVQGEGRIFATSQQEEMLYELSLTDGSLRPIIDIGDGVAEMLYDDGTLYATRPFHQEIVKMDVENESIETLAASGEHPHSMALDDGELYVANVYGNTVDVIDKERFEIARTIDVIGRPTGMIAYDEGILVGGHGPFGELNTEMHTYETSEETQIEVGLMPVAFLETTEGIVGVSHGSHEVFLYDTESKQVTDRLEVAHNPYYLVQANDEVAVSSLDGDEISFIDPQTWELIQAVEVAAGPHVMLYLEES
ncbi:hypothetical protein FLK61_24490 [Paenalkalicoccus suaedae]|uniref:YncE family protein n=1 Tax=Paenalkalicoccus suaedae TaxID=2592382 RepID=A0A859FAY5_9BACI|nr:hypothetical protein [Paenalkalicoccus suaedae]QKS69942.1 hypothetical protein FLK61_24490 [Paenalkalicoccus suaedae]